jgi:hypothetical protein
MHELPQAASGLADEFLHLCFAALDAFIDSIGATRREFAHSTQGWGAHFPEGFLHVFEQPGQTLLRFRGWAQGLHNRSDGQSNSYSHEDTGSDTPAEVLAPRRLIFRVGVVKIVDGTAGLLILRRGYRFRIHPAKFASLKKAEEQQGRSHERKRDPDERGCNGSEREHVEQDAGAKGGDDCFGRFPAGEIISTLRDS